MNILTYLSLHPKQRLEPDHPLDVISVNVPLGKHQLNEVHQKVIQVPQHNATTSEEQWSVR